MMNFFGSLTKGNSYLFGAHLLFYASGYAIHFVLSRIISAAEYGSIGVLLTLLTVLQIFTMKGVPTASAKYLSEGADGFQVRKKALTTQSLYTLIISFVVFLFAPILARLFGDVSYLPYIRFLSIVLFVRAINQTFNSFFNGYKQFGKQALHIAVDSIPRMILVFILVYLGLGVYGVLSGYAAASFIGILFASFLFRPVNTEHSISYRKIIDFSAPVILYSFFFQLAASFDLFFVKIYSSSGETVGYYTSARILCTFFIIVSTVFSLTLLPSISQSLSKNDIGRARSVIKTSLLYIAILFTAMALFISLGSHHLLAIAYTPAYSAAGQPLSILVWGWLGLQFFFVLSTIIIASGRPRIPACIAAVAAGVSFGANRFLVPHHGMIGGAIATLLTGTVCLAIAGYFVHSIYWRSETGTR
jgi:O-antigen/teichoic acid export membrane protein